jgi:hypothetical protein
MISKIKNKTNKRIYEYLFEKIGELLLKNNEIIKIITNNK